MTALHVSLAVDTKPCHEYRGDVNNIISLDIMKMGKKYFHEQFIVEIMHLYLTWLLSFLFVVLDFKPFDLESYWGDRQLNSLNIQK